MTNLRWMVLLLAALFLCSCSSPKVEFRTAGVTSYAADQGVTRGLTDVRTFIPDVAVDLRYATQFNLAHRPLYPPDMPCLLHPGTAVKLKKAQEMLRKKGLGLRIWDAWRPPEVQVLLVEKAGDTGLFMNPKSSWSRHCSGTAVDVTLVDERGIEQPMPTGHDEGGERASYNYKGGDRHVKENVHALQVAMTRAGFRIMDTEWWHFDDEDYFNTEEPIIYGRDVGVRSPTTE